MSPWRMQTRCAARRPEMTMLWETRQRSYNLGCKQTNEKFQCFFHRCCVCPRSHRLYTCNPPHLHERCLIRSRRDARRRKKVHPFALIHGADDALELRVRINARFRRQSRVEFRGVPGDFNELPFDQPSESTCACPGTTSGNHDYKCARRAYRHIRIPRAGHECCGRLGSLSHRTRRLTQPTLGFA